MWQFNATPNVSEYAHLSGPFNYNKIPLAPMVIEVQVHENTDKRGTWEYHTFDVWYLATSPEHYLTHRCHINPPIENVSQTQYISTTRISPYPPSHILTK